MAAYYYPWYGPDFHGRSYFRRLLDPPQQPLLGEYDDSKPETIAQHVRWSTQANIHTWIASWWGPGNRTDSTIREVILPHPEFQMMRMRVALFYETNGRLKERQDGSWDLSNVAPDLEYIAQHYFDNPHYLRIQGRPVLFIYLTRSLHKRGLLQQVVRIMREAATKKGHNNMFLVGDHVWQNAPKTPVEYKPFRWLDGVTNYDVFGNLKSKGDCYARQKGLDQYNTRQVAWRKACRTSGTRCAFVPSVSPGFNNKGKLLPLSRKLDERAEPGSLFRSMLKNALSATDERADHLAVITSWNEWHEDTAIEPVDTRNACTTNRPASITHGLDYDPYGTLYLDIVRQETSSLDHETGLRAHSKCM